MKRDEHVRRLDFSDEFLLESAEKRLQSGDALGALTVLNRRGEKYDPSADASALYADAYEALGLYGLAADAWFRFLDTCNEADFSEGYEGLAVAFMNMGDELQSAYFYHRAYSEDPDEEPEIEDVPPPPRLRLVEEDAAVVMQRGLLLLRAGELEEAKNTLAQVPESDPEYPSAKGLSAMCTLMLGEEESAEKECVELLKTHPDNVQALTTYCAVLGSVGNREGAREVAKKLADLPAEGTDDLYRIATALCETGLDREAYAKLEILKKKLPYDENVLYFHAVAAYRLGNLEDAISTLERMTTVYPRKAVARYYLERMRRKRDGEDDNFSMTYFYRLPEDEYNTVADFLLALKRDDDRAEDLAGLPRLNEILRLAFDEMEGRDEKLQRLAVQVAVKTRSDAFLREVLLDYNGDEFTKLSILHDLTVRNEDNSFGTVILNQYREFFTHEIEIGERKRAPFMRAFADVYAKYALIGDDCEDRLCDAAEDIYRSLADAGAWDYMEERTALAAAIYREARIRKGERDIAAIAKLFSAPVVKVKKILDFMI